MEQMPAKTVLLIKNQSEPASRIREMFNELDSNVFQVAHVPSVSAAERYLAANAVDIILLDLGLTEAHGLETFRRFQATEPHVSMVLLCDPVDEPIAVQAIHEGAQDYLINGQIEPRALKRTLLNAIERRSIGEILSVEKERAQVTLDCIGDAVVCTDSLGNITFLNRVAERMTGWQLKGCDWAGDGRLCPDCGRNIAKNNPGPNGKGRFSKSHGQPAVEQCPYQP